MEADSTLSGLSNKDDIKAFKKFFEGFYPSVCVFAQKYLKDKELAEDLAQEAFFEFWVRKDRFMDIKAMKHKVLNYCETSIPKLRNKHG